MPRVPRPRWLDIFSGLCCNMTYHVTPSNAKHLVNSPAICLLNGVLAWRNEDESFETGSTKRSPRLRYDPGDKALCCCSSALPLDLGSDCGLRSCGCNLGELPEAGLEGRLGEGPGGLSSWRFHFITGPQAIAH